MGYIWILGLVIAVVAIIWEIYIAYLLLRGFAIIINKRLKINKANATQKANHKKSSVISMPVVLNRFNPDGEYAQLTNSETMHNNPATISIQRGNGKRFIWGRKTPSHPSA
jgi:hypothetical protein